MSDCPECRVESAVVELLDPAVAQGVSVEGRCQLCGHQTRLGHVVLPGEPLRTMAAARAAVVRWAATEGEPDAEIFCQGSLGGRSLEAVCALLVRGEPISTSFDVLSMLFPGMVGSGGSGSSGGSGGEAAVFAPSVSMDGLDGFMLPSTAALSGAGPPLYREPVPVMWASPRLVQRSLSAVMLADGEVKPRERAFAEEYLAKEGLPPLEEEDIQPWRPGDLGWPADPAGVVSAMVALAHVDRQRDASEWRVVREFARHWGYPLSSLEAQGRAAEARVASVGQRLWRGLQGLLFVQDAPVVVTKRRF